MASSIKYDDRELKAALSKLAKKVKNPKRSMTRIGDDIRKGIGKQFDSEGRYWGTPWPERGFMIKLIREWQGYDPNTTLLGDTGGSAALRNAWLIQPIAGSNNYGRGGSPRGLG